MGAGARTRKRWWRGLLPLALLLALVIYPFTIPTCRTHRVVLANASVDAAHIKLMTVADDDGGAAVEVFWEGAATYGTPRRIPFVLFGEGQLRVEVRYEDQADPLVRGFATHAPRGIRPLYVVVGDAVILSFNAIDGGFDPPRGEVSGLARIIETVEYTLFDTLSCLDGA